MLCDCERFPKLGQLHPGPAAVAALARPSWPLVAMITRVTARTMTALEIRNRAVFDAGTMSRESWLIEASEAGMKDRHQQHAVSGHVVKPHEQGASEEQRPELDGEDDGVRDQRLDSPAASAKWSGKCHSAHSSAPYNGSFME